MDLDLDRFLDSFGEDAPSGPDLEYDSDFSEMEIAAVFKPEQQVGDNIIPAEDPDFNLVAEKTLAVLARSRDLRAAILLGQAALRKEGFVAFEKVMSYIRSALEDFWDSVHPQLDADDDNDPTMRINALVGLVDSDGLLRAMRRAPLTDSRVMGRLALRDIAVARGSISVPADMDSPPDMATVLAAFKDSPQDSIEANRSAIEGALSHIGAISDVLDDKVGSAGPDLSPLRDMLKLALSEIAEALGEAAPEEDEADRPAGGPAAPAATAGGGVGAISGPSDVTRAIDLISEYYARSEPSSPVPLLLARARRLVSADFVTIIKDMASDGADQVRSIGGLSEEDD
jgi:type VI secretion system protein ImpA